MTDFRKLGRILLCIVVIGVLVASGYIVWNRQRRQNGAPCKDCSILVVSLDTCAAEHFPCYGYGRDTAPNICSFAKSNVMFSNAFVNGTYTLPSHASLFTGLLPSVHGIEGDDNAKLSPSAPFLPDILSRNGYRTLMYMKDIPNLPQDRVYYRGITRIVSGNFDTDSYYDAALGELRQGVKTGQKTFVFLHTYRCHSPYSTDSDTALYPVAGRYPDIPLRRDQVFYPFTEGLYGYLLRVLPKAVAGTREMRERVELGKFLAKLESFSGYAAAKEFFADRSAMEKSGVFTSYIDSFYEQYYFWNRVNTKDPGQAAFIESRYDQALHDMDASLGKKISDLVSDPQIAGRTVVVLIGDHGESFGEHGIFSHGNLYDTNSRIPFIMHVPGVEPGVRKDNVQTADVLPTLLHAVGIAGTYDVDGTDLIPYLSGGRLPERLLVIDGIVPSEADRKVLRFGKWKLTAALARSKVMPLEMYDTASDPKESKDVLW